MQGLQTAGIIIPKEFLVYKIQKVYTSMTCSCDVSVLIIFMNLVFLDKIPTR